MIWQIIRTTLLGFLTAMCFVAVFGRGEVRAQEMTLDICPSDYGSFPENAPTLTCGCSAEAVKEGGVRGANPYYYQSSLCRAALHAGAVGAEGGDDRGQARKDGILPGGRTQRRDGRFLGRRHGLPGGGR